MKKIIFFTTVFLLVSSILFAEMQSDEVIKKVDENMNHINSQMLVKMEVYRDKTLNRTYKMKMKSGGFDKYLVEFVYPPRNKGKTVLRSDKNMWMYFPDISKVVRISGRASFASSDFSNTDILESSLGEDYNSKMLDENADYQGIKAYKIELLAKSDSVTYAKMIVWIRKDNFIPLRQDYYALNGEKLKTLLLKNQTRLLGQAPDTMIMNSVMYKDRYSVIFVEQFEPDQNFSTKIFNKNDLIKGK